MPYGKNGCHVKEMTNVIRDMNILRKEDILEIKNWVREMKNALVYSPVD